MKDGRQTEGGEKAQPAEKVVRLPRDWLGPRQDLVPFGPGATATESDSSASASSHDAPPSAADFWGERSAAIHGALEAPGEGVAGASRAEAAPAPRRVFAGVGARRIVAMTGLAVAAVAAVVLALGVLGPSGSASHGAGTARFDVAAVLSNGVSRTLQRGIALLDASGGRGLATPAAHQHARAVRRIRRPRPVFKRVHETNVSHSTSPASSAPAAPHAVVTSSAPTYTQTTVSRSSPTVHPSRSSAASVSPTGESGALGPIQSPNG